MTFKTMPFLFGQWAVSHIAEWLGLVFYSLQVSPLRSLWVRLGWALYKTNSIGRKIKVFNLGYYRRWASGSAVEKGMLTNMILDRTVSLVIFALARLSSSWVFGMDKGWKEITDAV